MQVMPVKKYLKITTYWMALFLGYMLSIIFVGTFLGAILYPLVGSLLRFNYSLIYMTQKGMADLSFFALVWAPGGAIVLCFIKAHRKKLSEVGIK